MKKLFSLSIALLIFAGLFAQTRWDADPHHSKLTFSINHLGISDISGLFQKFEVSATATKEDFSDAVFDLSVEVNSINTEVAMRDDHLRSADFFEVKKYPRMTFRSTSVRRIEGNKYKLNGNLTLHGITRAITMDLWYRGTIEHPLTKKPTAGFQLSGSINRADFNIGPKFPAPMLSNEVYIRADGEFEIENS